MISQAIRLVLVPLAQVTAPSFSDDAFLAEAIVRYDRFLGLMKQYGYKNHFFVPSYDIDLAWCALQHACACWCRMPDVPPPYA